MARSKFGKKASIATDYGDADTRNYEAFPAWSMPLDEQFRQLAFNGIIAHQFYCSEDEILRRGMGIIDKFVKENPAKALEIAATARNEGFIRSVNITTLAKASTSTGAFKEYFDKIVLTPRDMVQFIDVMRASRGLGRAIKETMNKWVAAKLDEFWAIKYRNQLQDSIRLGHAKFDDEAKAMLADYVMENGEQAKRDAIVARFPAINAVEMLKRINPLVDEGRAIDLITAARLDWNVVKGIFHPTPDIWKALAEQMSAIALVQNIASIERNAGADFALDIVKRKVTAEFLRRGKVFPFTLAQAYMHVNDRALKSAIGKVLDSLALAHDFSKLGRVAVCPDVSGSMTSPSFINIVMQRASGKGGKGDIPEGSMHVPIQVAAMIAGILAGATRDSRLLAWDTEVMDERALFGKDKEWRTPTRIMERLMRITGGGTFMEAPVKYLVEHRVDVDTFVLVTDSEEWGEGWLAYWKKYKQSHKAARAFLVRVDLYPTRPFGGDDCERLGITQIYGFSEMAFKVMLQ
ncbi:MAG: hypothetical protein Q6373_016720 [Candidatus Sigynarchaeota archaeon]